MQIEETPLFRIKSRLYGLFLRDSDRGNVSRAIRAEFLRKSGFFALRGSRTALVLVFLNEWEAKFG